METVKTFEKFGDEFGVEGIEVAGSNREILTPEALTFLRNIHREFNGSREALLNARAKRQKELDAGHRPDFLESTADVRRGTWVVAPAPADLADRRVEITGPAESKMMINALNSGAKVFMADLEDALSPTWENVIQGQVALKAAVRRTLTFESPEGKCYKLDPSIATLVVRPRGWHLEEKHIRIDGKAASASIVDFALYFFHNAHELVRRGSGPYFYLPKLENHLEARLWNDIFNYAQGALGLPRGTIRATVLIETILAAFEMDEILFELREHAAGLNAGRWDYIFSAIKKFRNQPDCVFPDRSQVTMGVPFMKAYAELLVKTCHRREAHAIGGMAAFIPSRKDSKVNEVAMAKVREDKERESRAGFDGTWVAHPDLVPLAKGIFTEVLGERPNQKERKRDDVVADAAKLLSFSETGGKATLGGFRSNIEIALIYIERWLSGLGAVAIHNLMEDAATAEISRAQLWQWIRQAISLETGKAASRELYLSIRGEELAALKARGSGRFDDAAAVLDGLVLSEDFPEFLTINGYRYMD